ncbi:MAG TPA: chemotaxis protein CheW [Burkholderiales bacterium]|nr:chemotaxis protein CheW [Burkholderiales bacterium]
MDWPHQIIHFSLAGVGYALDLAAVEKVIPIVEITPLPRAPEIVEGIINMRGKIIPIVNIRHRFRLPDRELSLSDRILIARTVKRTIGFVADAILGVMDCGEEMVEDSRDVCPGLEYLEGVMKIQDGVILIHDLDTFLSLDESELLDSALVSP